MRSTSTRVVLARRPEQEATPDCFRVETVELDDLGPGEVRVAVEYVSALNGVLGDTLAARGNALAIPMSFRREGRRLLLDPATLRASIPDASGKLLVLVHGSSMNDLQWTTSNNDHGATLSAQHGLTPVALHYNSGLHVAHNGRAFSALLEELVTSWPVPVTELVFLCHSMGGLVSRSACVVAEREGAMWRPLLRTMIFLGTPHHGAPLERGGNGIDLLLGLTPYSRPLSRLGKIRSAGVTDLRFGSVLDDDIPEDRFAKGKDPRTPTPLPAGVHCFAVAATTSGSDDDDDNLPGDGLVPVRSALGRHPDPAFALAFPPSHQWIVPKSNHLDLLRNPAVLEPLSALWPESA